MNVPTLHIVSYFAGTDAFMSLHKSIITLFLTPKKTFYEFTNNFHAKYKPIRSKCWLEWTDGKSIDYMLSPLGSIKIKTATFYENYIFRLSYKYALKQPTMITTANTYL